MIKPQKLKPCACIITDGNPSFAVCTEFERGFPEPGMETPSLHPCVRRSNAAKKYSHVARPQPGQNLLCHCTRPFFSQPHTKEKLKAVWLRETSQEGSLAI